MGQLFPYSFASLRPLGLVSVAVATTAVTTLSPPLGATGALIQATGGNINWRDDGTPPTNAAGGGMVLAANAEPQWYGVADLAALKFIAVGTTTFLLVSFYG